jgi:hypothetical protein
MLFSVSYSALLESDHQCLHAIGPCMTSHFLREPALELYQQIPKTNGAQKHGYQIT